MRLSVFDGDPSRLAWSSSDGVAPCIGLFKTGSGIVEATLQSGRKPPTDLDLQKLIWMGKTMSEGERGSVFAVMFRARRGEKRQMTPFAEFKDGSMVAFCRPPWRKGQGLM